MRMGVRWGLGWRAIGIGRLRGGRRHPGEKFVTLWCERRGLVVCDERLGVPVKWESSEVAGIAGMTARRADLSSIEVKHEDKLCKRSD